MQFVYLYFAKTEIIDESTHYIYIYIYSATGKIRHKVIHFY